MLIWKIIVIIKLVENIKANSSLSDVAAFLGNTAYKPDRVTSLIWSNNQSELVTDFMKRFYGSVVTSEIQNNNNHNIRWLNKAVGYKQTVLFVGSVEEFAYFITSVNVDLIEPIRLILVITTIVEDLSVVTWTAWKNDVADIIIVNQNNNGNISLSTYLPYGNGVCGDYTPVDIKMDAEQLFPKKFRNFYGCPIRAAFSNFLPYMEVETMNDNDTSIRGIDGIIFIELIDAVNGTIDVVSIEDDDEAGSYINGTPRGRFGQLVKKEADIIAPAAIMNYERYNLAQISHVYDTLDVHWCAPPRRAIFTWAKVLLPLFDFITILMFITFAVFVVVTALVKKCVVPRITTQDNVIFQTYGILIGQLVKFRSKSYLVNYLFVLWLWFCFVFRIGYQGDLIQGMHELIQEPPLGTIDNALKYVDGYGGHEVLSYFYKDTPIADNYQILSVNEVHSYIKAMAAGKKFLLLTDILIPLEYDAKVQIVEEPVSRAITSLFMRPGWPAAKQLDLVMQYIIESGIPDRVLRNYFYTLEKNHRKNIDEHPPLDFLTLSACFYGLAVMWIITSIIFFFELTHVNKQQKRINKQ